MLLFAKRLLVLVQARAFEGEVFRPLADARDAALVPRHVLRRELGESVLRAVVDDLVVGGHRQFGTRRRVGNTVAGLHAVLGKVEVSELGIDEVVGVE